MSRNLFFALISALFCVSVSAQDVILKTDASEIEAKILEVSETEIRYKSWTNQEGPTRIINLSNVFRVKYANGEIEVFSRNPESAHSGQISAGGYRIGDVYDKDGLRGIVVHVTDGGRHGLILNPYTAQHVADYGYWCANSVEDIGIGMNDENDGMRNLMILAEFIESGRNERITWERFPVFAACAELGEGWYVPAINELTYIVSYMCGGDPGRITDLAEKEFAEKMEELGDVRYYPFNGLFSSTERKEDEVYGYSREMMSNAGYGWFATVNYGYEKTSFGKHSGNWGTFFYVHKF